MLGGRDVKAIYELHGQGQSVRAIARHVDYLVNITRERGAARSGWRGWARAPGRDRPDSRS